MSENATIKEMRLCLIAACDALELAFCHDSVTTDALSAEIKAGRWDGVRTIIERGREAVKEFPGEAQ